MKAHTTWTYGPRKFIRTDGAVFNYTNGYVMYDNASPGAIVHGNHRDPNSWNYSTVNHRLMPGTQVQAFYTWGAYQYYIGYMSGQHVSLVPNASTARNQVYNMALGRLNERVRGGLDLGLDLVEAGQTARMIAALRNFLNFARLRGFGSTRDLANGWLQWQYGWSPLVQDIFDALDESLNICITRLKKVRASATIPLKYDGDGSGTYIGNRWITSRNESKGKASCRMCLTFEMKDFDLARWSSLNPVSLGWEIIPYSFVIDWFYDVGSYLRDAETQIIYNSRFVSGYVSELIAWDGKETCRYNSENFPTANPPHSDYWYGFDKSYRYRWFQRSKLTSYPLPRPPVFQADLGWRRLLSAAALLRQLLKK